MRLGEGQLRVGPVRILPGAGKEDVRGSAGGDAEGMDAMKLLAWVPPQPP